MGYLRQYTSAYKTYIKRALVESLTAAFTGHPDPTVQGSKVAIDYTEDDFKLPAVIIGYAGKLMPNAGVGHFEYLPDPLDADPTNPETRFIQYEHRMYKGDVSFTIYGMSSADRDILSDAVVEVLAMADVSTAGQAFLGRFYTAIPPSPYALWHFPTLNLDLISEVPEQAVLAPWMSEDQLVYQVGHTVPIFGEFYSYTPPEPPTYGPLTEVDVYPWLPGVDPAPPVPDEDYYHFKGNPPEGDPASKTVPEG